MGSRTVTVMSSMQAASASPGFRPFAVIGKRPENRLVTSFWLQPLDPQGWRPFEPGQFLMLRLPGPDGAPVLKHYSVSSDPAAEGSYRITVKRETAARPGLPDGIGSSYLHDHVDIGAILSVEGPRGEFRLDRLSRRPVVLLSGGVGLTPLVSMLHALSGDAARRVLFLHACQDGSRHTLADEIAELARCRPGVTVHTVYQSPTAADRAAGRHHSEGFVTLRLLKQLLPPDACDCYLCGPSGFMQAVYGMLRALGVPKERIAYEFFGPATVLDPEAPLPASSAAISPIANKGATSITLARSRRTLPWNGGTGSLLDFLEAQGLSPEFSCRAGVCGTCKVGLLAGEVRYTDPPLDPVEPGAVLLCCSQPLGSVVLDL